MSATTEDIPLWMFHLCVVFFSLCLVIANGPGTTLGFVAIEHPNKQLEHPCSPCTVLDGVVTAAQKGKNEFRERSKHGAIRLIKPGEVSSIREVSNHPTAEDAHRAEFQLVGDLVLPHEHESIKREGLLRVPFELLLKTLLLGMGDKVSGTGSDEDRKAEVTDSVWALGH